MFRLSEKSLNNLDGVHPDLIDVVELAIKLTEKDFSVLEGVRSKDRQAQLVAEGKSQTMNSRHITGHAVDLIPYPVSWEWDEFFPIADAMIDAAATLDTPIRWGGNWGVHDLRSWDRSSIALNNQYTGSFPDAPHFELSRRFY